MLSRIQNFPLGTSPAWYHLPSGSLLQPFPHIKPMRGSIFWVSHGSMSYSEVLCKKEQVGTVNFLRNAYSAFERHA